MPYRIESGEPWRAKTILDLYIRFKVFVNGYKSVFRSERVNPEFCVKSLRDLQNGIL